MQTLFILGTLLIAMSMQLDRKGLWNLLGPIICAILIMVAAWVSLGHFLLPCPRTLCLSRLLFFFFF